MANRREAKQQFTDFQKAVYKVVSEIPKGETRSYKWVARRIGKPKAARAVGQALKRNPLVGIVPCHRVIASDGSLGGFSKGIKRKIEMLRAEGLREIVIASESRRLRRRAMKRCRGRHCEEPVIKTSAGDEAISESLTK